MKKLLILFFTVFLFQFNYPQQKLSLSVDEAIKLGLKNSKNLNISLMNVKSSEFKLKETNAGRYPSLKFLGAYTRLSKVDPFNITTPFGSFVVSPSILDNWTTRLTLAQPLFTGFKLDAASDISDYNFQATSEEYNKDKEEFIFNIKNSYWNYFKAIQMKKVVDETFQQISAHLADTKNLLGQGLLTNNDVLKLEVQLSEVKLRQIDAENGVKLSMISLCNTLGISLKTEIEITSSAFGVIKDFGDPDALITKAINNRPEIKAADLRIKMSESSVTLSKANWYPQIFLAGNYNFSRPNQRIVPGKDEWRGTWDVGVSMSFDIWNWMITSHQTEQAEAQLNQTIDALASIKDAITLEVTSNYLSILQAKEKISISRFAVSQAEENMRVTEQKYKNGMALSSDVIDAEVALLVAKTNYTNALVDYEVAQAKLEKSVGK
jgi:outer membrane protein TolC